MRAYVDARGLRVIFVESESKKVKAFGQDARLTNKSKLDAVKNGGVKLVGRYSIVLMLANPPDGARRAAFLISRRFDLLAVVRNRARRLYREAFRMMFDDLPPVWLLFIPKRGIKGKKLDDVMPEIRNLVFQALNGASDGKS